RITASTLTHSPIIPIQNWIVTMIKRRSVLLPSALLLVGALATIWWFVAVRDQGAAELLYGACQDISAEESYDFTSTIVGPWSFAAQDELTISTFIVQARIAGDDLHLKFTHDDPKNSYETMVVDGIKYANGDKGKPWRRDDSSLRTPEVERSYMRQILNIDSVDGPNSLCPPENAHIMGLTEHEGITVQHLRLVKMGDILRRSPTWAFPT
ncbi:MAG: hypothetical protein J4F46_08605, partial [Dehalococcoidia bacterium]|nr:hypothetical protein [Dehalococcoidia bacterium]